MDAKDKDYLKIDSKIKYFIFLCFYFLLYPICKLFYGRKNKWLICDIGDNAQDNGYFFFKYLRENHLEIKPVFLIKKNSPDYSKVTSIGKVVEFGSIKHLLMAIGYKVKISDHLFGYAPWVQLQTYYRRNKTHDIHVFLQHGITKNYQKGFIAENCKSLDLFVCGANPEYLYIKDEFGYKNSEIQYTGFPRYDSLCNVHKKGKSILIFPTWRRYLSGISEEDFAKSEFFMKWSEILYNENLFQTCLEKGVTILFCLHPTIQKFRSFFKENTLLKIVNIGEENVQTLINESDLLVTDFSSVYYDFAYLLKPLAYFQFDEKDYYKLHYDKGYFDYRRDGFGPVFTYSAEVINFIKEKINNGFTNDSKYLKKVRDNFAFIDQNNCLRVFNYITMLQNQR